MDFCSSPVIFDRVKKQKTQFDLVPVDMKPSILNSIQVVQTRVRSGRTLPPVPKVSTPVSGVPRFLQVQLSPTRPRPGKLSIPNEVKHMNFESSPSQPKPQLKRPKSLKLGAFQPIFLYHSNFSTDLDISSMVHKQFLSELRFLPVWTPCFI